jgi:hypothetical protein
VGVLPAASFERAAISTGVQDLPALRVDFVGMFSASDEIESNDYKNGGAQIKKYIFEMAGLKKIEPTINQSVFLLELVKY